MKQVIAIGGGGFGREIKELKIEKYIVDQSNKKNPSICFIPTATGDDSHYIENFYKAFDSLGCKTSHIDFFKRTINLEKHIDDQDIIFVGGGNTKSMLAVWREWKLDKILYKAYIKGTIMSGVSAGAICWFERGITDSWASELKVLDCLGVLKGVCCPHYDGEKDRRPSVEAFLKNKIIEQSLCIEDGAAAHFENGSLKTAISFYKSKKKNVFNVSYNEKLIEKPLNSIDIFK